MRCRGGAALIDPTRLRPGPCQDALALPRRLRQQPLRVALRPFHHPGCLLALLRRLRHHPLRVLPLLLRLVDNLSRLRLRLPTCLRRDPLRFLLRLSYDALGLRGGILDKTRRLLSIVS